jgi:phage replication-related protein YjqB (UPF0714/DUF867 family)
VREVLELRSPFGFLAFHGGSLERMTDRIASEAAERSGASLYAVVQPPDLRWHVPSVEVTPDASPDLAAFLGHVEVAVAVHGFGRHGLWSTLLVGGGNRPLATHVGSHLAAAVPDHDVCTDLDEMPAELRGVHGENPVNRCRAGGGVQLELPPGIRGLTPRWAGWAGPSLPPPTEALVDAFAAARDLQPPNGASRAATQGAARGERCNRV